MAMIQLALQDHPVWQDLAEVLESLDSNALVREHLEACAYRICGYWDEQDNYYEEIALPEDLAVELVSSSIEVTHQERFLKLKFLLTATANSADSQAPVFEKIGGLLLVYNEKLEFIDENWCLEIKSPLLKATQG
jgi:hypothetical protein